jgi:opacity protein-like surface antigen
MKIDTVKYATAKNLAPSSVVPYSGAVRAFSILINFRGTFAKDTRSIGPYFQIGIGYMNVAQNAISVSPDTTKNIAEESRSAFSWSAGVGIDVPLGENMVVFAQIKSAIAVLDPVRQYFPLSAGVRYRW